MLDLGLLPHLLTHGFVLLLSYGVSRPRQEALLLTLPLVPGLSREHRTGVLQGVSKAVGHRLVGQALGTGVVGRSQSSGQVLAPCENPGNIKLGFCCLKFLGLSKMRVR